MHADRPRFTSNPEAPEENSLDGSRFLRHPSETLTRRSLIAATLAVGEATLPLMAVRASAQDQVIEPSGPDQPTETVDSGQIIEPTDPNQVEPTPVDSQGIELPSGDAQSTENSLYFAVTGHNLTTPFLLPWQDAGGESVLGQPLSEGRFVDSTGTIQQAFETLTLEYVPEADGPGLMRATVLPSALVNKVATGAARKTVTGCSGADASCTFVPETSHTVSGAIAAFWAEQGPLLLGAPVSEPFVKANATTQVFERAVVDVATNGKVSLRKVMIDEVAASALATDAAFVPAPPSLGKTTLVKADDGLRLRSKPAEDGEVLVVIPDSAEFIAAGEADGGWVPGYVDGYSGWVSAEFLTEPKSLPTLDLKDWDLSAWQGAALGETNLRATSTTSSKSTKLLAFGDPVVVTDWVEGEEVFEGANIWAKTKDGSFVYARNIGRSAPVAPTPIPADAPTWDKWIDVNLTQQLMIAYEGSTPVRTVVTTTGMPGWETPEGWFAINNRVANETMGSGSIGAEKFFELKNVLFTQYFTDVGHAIHFAWWRTPETIGRPGSHGCLNLLLDDSQFFWDWATYGTPVIVHK